MRAFPSISIIPALLLLGNTVQAHDPVFSPGPHVLYKEGIEIHLGSDRQEAGSQKESELALELTYGLTGDWAAGISLPYKQIDTEAGESSGRGETRLFTKYRFWRQDSLGVQESAAVLARLMLDDGDPRLGSGTTDLLLGATYGYESLRWYRWSSLRYRRNGEDDARLRRGDAGLIDFALGYRPTMPRYLQPDTVWIVELNGEFNRPTRIDGAEMADSGGSQWFVSPGIFWTLRNFAIKAGMQLPVASSLRGDQPETDYRAKLELEWHL